MSSDRAPLRGLSHVQKLLLRRSWLIVGGAVLAAVAGWTIAGKNSPEIEARQPLALREVLWNDIPVAHERNRLWIDNATPASIPSLSDPTVSIFLRPPAGDTVNSFEIVARAPTERQALTAAAEASDALLQSQGGLDLAPEIDLGELEAELRSERESKLASMDKLGDEAVILLEQRDRIFEAGGPWADQERLRVDANLLNQEREALGRGIIEIDEALDNLDTVSVTPIDSIEILGPPQRANTNVAGSPGAVASLAAFVAATVLIMAVTLFDRTWARVRRAGQITVVGSPATILSLAEGSSKSADRWQHAQLATLARLVGSRTEPGDRIALIGTRDDNARLLNVALALQSKLRLVGERALIAEGLSASPSGPAEQRVLVLPDAEVSPNELAATIGQCILAVDSARTRVRTVNQFRKKLENLDVNVLAIVIAPRQALDATIHEDNQAVPSEEISAVSLREIDDGGGVSRAVR